MMTMMMFALQVAPDDKVHRKEKWQGWHCSDCLPFLQNTKSKYLLSVKVFKNRIKLSVMLLLIFHFLLFLLLWYLQLSAKRKSHKREESLEEARISSLFSNIGPVSPPHICYCCNSVTFSWYYIGIFRRRKDFPLIHFTGQYSYDFLRGGGGEVSGGGWEEVEEMEKRWWRGGGERVNLPPLIDRISFSFASRPNFLHN